MYKETPIGQTVVIEVGVSLWKGGCDSVHILKVARLCSCSRSRCVPVAVLEVDVSL